MYRVKVKNVYGTTEDETFWTEENDAQREFDGAKDYMTANPMGRLDEVQLDELEVNTGNGTSHRKIDSFRVKI